MRAFIERELDSIGCRTAVHTGARVLNSFRSATGSYARCPHLAGRRCSKAASKTVEHTIEIRLVNRVTSTHWQRIRPEPISKPKPTLPPSNPGSCMKDLQELLRAILKRSTHEITIVRLGHHGRSQNNRRLSVRLSRAKNFARQ